MDKKIIVRYHPGACGRFYACLIQTILDPTFDFWIDRYGGVHTFPGEKIGDHVYHSHNRMVDCMLNNLNVDLYIVQITINAGAEHTILNNYWVKCLQRFWQVDQINRITQQHRGWQDSKWAIRQLTKPYHETDALLREILLQDMDYWDNKETQFHPRIMNMPYAEFWVNNNFGDDLAGFLSVSTYDKQKVQKIIATYKAMQPLLNTKFKI